MQKYLYNLAMDKPPHQRFWCGGKYSRFIISPIKIFLWILSLVYGLIVRILIFFYSLRPYQLNCKVISIGNITLGGTGKTTLVEFIARYLKQQGHKVAILSRGYKRKTMNYQLSTMNYEIMGDEPYMLQMRLEDIPIIVDADRVRAGNRAIHEFGVDTVILDDSFQQWKIRKDLEIVTIDATNPFGNRYMMPRGILREPLSSLKRADIFVITKINLCTDTDIEKIKDELNKLNPKGLIIESVHKPLGFYNIDKPKELFNVGSLKGKAVTLFSGIGDPDSFDNLIDSLSIKIGLSFKFSDHHNYTRRDLHKIIKGSKDKFIDTIITTEKDAARFYDLRQATVDIRLLVLRIELAIKDEHTFCNRLLKLYSL